MKEMEELSRPGVGDVIDKAPGLEGGVSQGK